MWKYFEKYDEKSAKCKLCQKNIKTTNLMGHIRNGGTYKKSLGVHMDTMKASDSCPKGCHEYTSHTREQEQAIPMLGQARWVST